LIFATRVVMNESNFLRKRGEMGHGRRQAARMTPRLLAALLALFVVGLTASSGTKAAVGTTFTVDTTDGTTDSVCGGASDCSFGDAIEAANANLGPDTIAFAIPGDGPHLIVLSTPPLVTPPFATDAVVIDGGTQPGYAGTPLVEIDASGWGFGLMIQGAASAGTEVRGLAIHGSTEGNAIRIDNPGGNVVEQNFIGTNASGTAVEGGARVYVSSAAGVSSANTIADNVIAGTGCCVQFSGVSDSQVLRNYIGTDASGTVGLSDGTGVGIQVFGDRNLLSGNVIARTETGIFVQPPSSDTRIEANRIGTDKDGKHDLGNSSLGIHSRGGTRTIVGGADPAAQNVISGNGAGIDIFGSDTVVQGNLIGTDITGTLDLGNHGGGIIGGGGGASSTPLIADNVVSGNEGAGVGVCGGDPGSPSTARIEHNLIGTNAEGTNAIPNDGSGVAIGCGGGVIGGESPTQRNVISGNGGDGVVVFPDVSGLLVLNNYIGTNKDGDGGLGNGGVGVFDGGHDTTIGRPGAGNVISANGGAGVRLSSDGAVVQSNLIGTNASGEAALGNGGAGLLGGNAFDPRIGGADAGEGNLISGNGRWGIQLMGGDPVGTSVIERNRIGTNEAGEMSLPNAAGGIDIIGAPFDIMANLISGNGGDGLHAAGAAPSRVTGNLIGTDADGVSDLGNRENGVNLYGEGGAIVVGGTTPDDRNVISGNGRNGVLHASSVRHDIVGNYIGTDVDGTREIPNDLSGVRLDGSTTVRDNVVSGNRLDGIELHSAFNEVRGNLVGTGASGASPLGNLRHGVSIDGGGENTIGGPVGDGNTIAFNGGHGILIRRASLNLVKRNEIFSNGADGVAVVEVPPFGAIWNTISENAISSNTGLGIDLGDDRVTPNDPGDADSGANHLQNFPENLQVSADGTTVTGELNTIPDRSYTIEVFENTSCDSSGFGEGEEWIGSTDMSTAGGNSSFSVLLSSPLEAGSIVTATATDADGNTSEFSPCETPSGTIIVRKATVPSPDPTDTSFAFTAGGGLSPASFSLKNGESQPFADLVPQAGYSVAETTPAGWDSTSACSDGSPVSNIDVGPGETVTCTFTNTKRGTATVIKTVNGLPPTGGLSFTFQIRQGASTISAGTTLEERNANAGNGGVIHFATLLGPGTTYQLCEIVMPGWMTTLGPPFFTVFNPSGDNSTVCTNFTAQPGELPFTINNIPPPGGLARTIGFWKNWASCSGSRGNQRPVLDRTLAAAEPGGIMIGDLILHGSASNPDVAPDCQKAVRLLNKSRISDGRRMSNDPAFNLAAQLLAAKLNIVAGAGTCPAAITAINDAQALLDATNFNGNTHLNMTTLQRNLANSLAATLDRYNNDTLC
jgi:hypothetical protein